MALNGSYATFGPYMTEYRSYVVVGPKMTRATLEMAMTAMADPQSVAADVAKRLGITTTTLYTYVNGDGSPKAAGQALLENKRDSSV